MSVETRIKAEQDRVEKIEAKLAELEATLDKQLLSDNQTTVPQLDAEIAAERRALARCQKTIALLTEQQKREIEATARKNKNQHIDRVQDEIGEYRKCIVRLAKHLADSVKDWHEAQDRAVRL